MALGLERSGWTMCSVRGQSPLFSSVRLIRLVTTTVDTERMQESDVSALYYNYSLLAVCKFNIVVVRIEAHKKKFFARLYIPSVKEASLNVHNFSSIDPITLI